MRWLKSPHALRSVALFAGLKSASQSSLILLHDRAELTQKIFKHAVMTLLKSSR
jgi:hypothetical protein